MKKITMLALMLAVVPMWAKGSSSGGSKKGSWDFGGSVGLTWVGNTPYPTISAYATYNMLSYLDWTTEIEVIMHTTDSMDISVPSTLKFYPLAGKQKIDPYFGPGVTYTRTYDGKDAFGGHAVIGVDFLFIKGAKFGIEGKLTYYLVPDKSYTWTVGPTGSWNIDF